MKMRTRFARCVGARLSGGYSVQTHRVGMERLESRRLLSTLGDLAPDVSDRQAAEELVSVSGDIAEATSGRLFALHVDGNKGRIYELNPDTGASVNSFPTPQSIKTPGYQGLALGPDNLFFLDGTGRGPHTLYELDPATGSVIDSDLVGNSNDRPVSGLAYQNGFVYLGRASDQSLLEWDVVNDCVVRTISVDFAMGGGLTGTSEPGIVYNSNNSGDVIAIAVENGQVIKELHAVQYPFSGGLAFVNGELFGGDPNKRRIYRIDPDTGGVLGNFLSPGSGVLAGLAGDGAAVPGGEIRGSVWNDANGNRLWDDGETPLENWTVFLDDNWNGSYEIGEPFAVSASDGSYSIGDVVPGIHVVAEDVPSNWIQTFPGATPSEGRLFALQTNDVTKIATIAELDPDSGTILNEFCAPGNVASSGAQGLAVGPDRLYYVEGNSFVLHELSLDTGAVIDSHVLMPEYEETISGLAYLDGILYLVQHDGERLLAWDSLAKTLLGTQSIPGVDLGGSLTGAGNLGLLFCGNSSGEILAIDATTGNVERSFSTGLGQLQGGMAYVGGELIAAPFGTSVTAHRIDPVSGNSLGTADLSGLQLGSLSGLGGDGAVGTGDSGTHIVNVASGLVVEGADFGNTEVGTSESLIGTTDRDVILVETGSDGHAVTLNGERRILSRTVKEIHIDGLGGNDTITVYGTDGDESAILRLNSVNVSGPGYEIRAVSVEAITVEAGGGAGDEATLYGSTSSNRLYSYPEYSRLTDSTRSFSHRVKGFETLTVDVSGGSTDSAYLYDTPDDDELTVEPGLATFTRSAGTATETTTIAIGFQQVYTYATEGEDTAAWTASDATQNRFYGYADYALFTEARRSFYFYARGFDDVTATSPASLPAYAYLYDSPEVDAFIASTTSATMNRDDSWSDTTATGFARIYAYSTRGGADTAVLNGSSTGGNNYRGYPAYSTLYDSTQSFYHYVRGFHSVTAAGSKNAPSRDRAYLYDSPGADTFDEAFWEEDKYQGGSLTDTGNSYELWIKYFDYVYARSTDSGPGDTIAVENETLLAYRLLRMGTW